MKKLLKNIKSKLFKLFNLYKTYLSYSYWKNYNQIKKYKKLIKDLRNAYKLLTYLDKKLQIYGWSRQKRRQFWRDFYQNAELRTEVFENLLKEINQIRRK